MSEKRRWGEVPSWAAVKEKKRKRAIDGVIHKDEESRPSFFVSRLPFVSLPTRKRKSPSSHSDIRLSCCRLTCNSKYQQSAYQQSIVSSAANTTPTCDSSRSSAACEESRRLSAEWRNQVLSEMFAPGQGGSEGVNPGGWWPQRLGRRRLLG